LSLLLVLAAAAETPICADRPAKANAVCTVPAGDWQVEIGAVDWVRIREEGETAKALTLGSSLFKYGIDERSDVELSVTPYVRVKGGGETVDGFGDMTVRYKRRLTAASAPVQVDALPFVKLPTAGHSIGDGKVEGGLAVPVSYSLGGPVSATLGPEVDAIADIDGHGYHPVLVNVINMTASVTNRLAITGELWSSFNFDPAETITQASADAAVAYAVLKDMQVDAGANFGLTRETPDVEIYFGISIRR